METSKIWWQSKTIWMVLLSMIFGILHQTGVVTELAPEAYASLADLIVNVATYGFGGLAVWARVSSTQQVTVVSQPVA